jgi:hypothetical protein
MARARRKRSEAAPADDAGSLDEAEAALSQFTRYAVRAGLLTTRSENDTQTSLRLPSAMYAALDEAADQHGRRIGEEIRLRLENSFVLEIVEPETRALAQMIATAARNIEPPYGSWRENPYAFLVFKEAVNALLAYLKPKGEPVAPKRDPDDAANIFFGANAAPETAGKALAMAALAAAGRLREGR